MSDPPPEAAEKLAIPLYVYAQDKSGGEYFGTF